MYWGTDHLMETRKFTQDPQVHCERRPGHVLGNVFTFVFRLQLSLKGWTSRDGGWGVGGGVPLSARQWVWACLRRKPVSGFFFFFNASLGLFINWKGCFSFPWVH